MINMSWIALDAYMPLVESGSIVPWDTLPSIVTIDVLPVIALVATYYIAIERFVVANTADLIFI